jgi:transcriptional regulator with XRE-family HTH domain
MTGRELREWRIKLNLSQADLAEKLDVSPDHIRLWEDQPQISKILELAMDWIIFEMLKPSREELDATYREIEETLERTSKLLQS